MDRDRIQTDEFNEILRNMQVSIMRRSCHIPEDGRVSIQLIREFEWASNWAETLVDSLEGDSIYPDIASVPGMGDHHIDQILAVYDEENALSSVGMNQTLTPAERFRIADRLRHYTVTAIDHAVLDAIFDACNWVIVESITEENCLKELASAQDAVQRAELYMLMGNDVEAYREFIKISQEEISNPENALALVNLVERYENPKAALKILRRWFLLEIVLHALPFDLVCDLIPDRKKKDPSARVRYLQSILLHSGTMTDDELMQHMWLVLPHQSVLKPDLDDVERRLKWFGLSMDRLDLMLDDDVPVNLFTMMSSLMEQLVHMAELAKSIENPKLGISALERAVLMGFVMIQLPEPVVDDSFEQMISDLNLTSQIVLDTLEEIEEVLEDLVTFSDADLQSQFLVKQIEALRRLLKQKQGAGVMGKSDGVSGLSRKHDSH